MRFWDSSAIVPLLVHQKASVESDRWLRDDAEIAVWTLTPVEVVSALRRLVRDGDLAESIALAAERRLDELMPTCHVVIDVEGVKSAARRMLRVHALRAADALQLAAAIAWSAGDATSCLLHTFDVRLARAAQREGLQVMPAPD